MRTNDRFKELRRASGSSWKTIALLLCLARGQLVQAYQGYNVVTTTDAVLEQEFLSATTNQFQATLFVNPLFSGTYQLKLQSLNPAYAPALPPTTLQDALSLGATVYAYGWAMGESYQQTTEINATAYLGYLCDSATNFVLVNETTNTFSTATCRDIIGTVLDQLYALSLSTPTPIPQ